MKYKIFCNQCQESAKNIGYSIQGVCEKTSDVANLQGVLSEVLLAM